MLDFFKVEILLLPDVFPFHEAYLVIDPFHLRLLQSFNWSFCPNMLLFENKGFFWRLLGPIPRSVYAFFFGVLSCGTVDTLTVTILFDLSEHGPADSELSLVVQKLGDYSVQTVLFLTGWAITQREISEFVGFIWCRGRHGIISVDGLELRPQIYSLFESSYYFESTAVFSHCVKVKPLVREQVLRALLDALNLKFSFLQEEASEVK